MADFILTRTGAQVDDVVTAGNNAGATGSDTLLHSGNTGAMLWSVNRPVNGGEANEIIVTPANGSSNEMDFNTTAATLRDQLRFYNPNGQVGGITTNASATAYNTSSDPRLKDFKGQPVDAEVDAEFNKLFSCFDTFNWKSDPEGQLVWGFDAHLCIDAKLDMGSEGEGPRDLDLGDVYDTTPAVFDEDDNEIKPAIEHKVSPAGIDQAKAVPILLAKIEQQGRYMTALQIGLNDALSRLEAAGL